MKVYRPRKVWTGQETNFHLVEKIGSKPGTMEKLIAITYETYCYKTFTYSRGDESLEFDREKHTKRVLCMDCVRNYNIMRQHRMKK